MFRAETKVDDNKRYSDFFDGQIGAKILRGQLSALEAYERLLGSDHLDCKELNEIIKAALSAHLGVIRATGEVGSQMVNLHRTVVEQLRGVLSEQLKNYEAAKPEDERPEGSKPEHPSQSKDC